MVEVSFRVVDIETTCVDPPERPHDGVCEIGFIDVLAKFRDDGAFAGALIDPKPGFLLYAPPGGIPPETRAIHHIDPKDVEGAPPCTEGAIRLLLAEPKPYALVAHNSKFEEAWLSPALGPHRWVCTYKVAKRLHPEWPSASNQAARYLLGLELDDAFAMPPHRAGPDAYVTAHIFVEFLKAASVRQMVEWTKAPVLLTTCPIGKDWRGKAWSELDESSLRWIVGKGAEMDADVLYWAKHELERRAAMARDPDLAEGGY